MTKDEGVSQLLSAMSALIDNCNTHMKLRLANKLTALDSPQPYEQTARSMYEKGCQSTAVPEDSQFNVISMIKFNGDE